MVTGAKVVTNEHVAAEIKSSSTWGQPSYPSVWERVDEFNDLELLSAGAELALIPLPLADRLPSPGTSVYAIGNH